MPHRLADHGAQAPADRFKQIDGEFVGYMFPGEVGAALNISQIDYAQLRRLYRLIRRQAKHTPARGWSRYTFADIASLMVVLDLCGGVEALRPGRRLNYSTLEEACESLVSQGISNPLLSVRLIRRGRVIYAEVDGVLLDPRTGQLLMEEVSQVVDAYFDHQLLRDPSLAKALSDEIRRHRQNRLRQPSLLSSKNRHRNRRPATTHSEQDAPQPGY